MHLRFSPYHFALRSSFRIVHNGIKPDFEFSMQNDGRFHDAGITLMISFNVSSSSHRVDTADTTGYFLLSIRLAARQ